MSALTTISEACLGHSVKLQSVELRLPALTTIHTCFMIGCKSLTSISFQWMSNVTYIGNGFMYKCVSLTSLDLEPLIELTTIGNEFVCRCKSLQSIVFKLPKLVSIGTGIAFFCHELKTLKLDAPMLKPMYELEFTNRCSALTIV